MEITVRTGQLRSPSSLCRHLSELVLEGNISTVYSCILNPVFWFFKGSTDFRFRQVGKLSLGNL